MKIYNKSVEGAGHKGTGVPCQDYSISQFFEKGSIIAVSDGHGSKTYVRSDVGSKLACEIAVEQTKQFVIDNYDELKIKGEKEIKYTPDSGEVQDPELLSLFTSVHDKWYEAIKKHKEDNIFTEEEAQKLGDADIKKAYGCTLIVAVKTTDFTFAYQIGDGRLFFIMPDTIRWRQPVPWDSKCEDNITTSLCNNNPVVRFRYYLSSEKNQPFAIFICSDGIEDCFNGKHNAEFESPKLYADYSKMLGKFLQDEQFDEYCEQYLLDESTHGSKDDMSIAFVIDDIYNIQDLWIELNGYIQKRIYIDLEVKQYEKLEKECNQRLQKIQEALDRVNAALKKIADKEDQIRDLRKRLEDIDNQSSVRESFLGLTESINNQINSYCAPSKVNVETHDANGLFKDLKSRLTKAIREVDNYICTTLKRRISENKNKVTEQIDELNKEIQTKERYTIDKDRLEKNRAQVNEEKEANIEKKKDCKKRLEEYKVENQERLNKVKKQLQEKITPQVLESTNLSKNVEQYEISDYTWWTIAKGEDEYINIHVCTNNVQIEHYPKYNNNPNSYNISHDSFKGLKSMIEDAFRSVESNERNEVKITAVCEMEFGLEGDSNTNMPFCHAPISVWDSCMELIKNN